MRTCIALAGLLCLGASAGFAGELFRKPVSMNGASVVTVVEVNFRPGESHGAHAHDAHTVVYVLEGEIESQLGGEKPKVYAKGATFYEAPGQTHAISRNKSDTQPARILVYFLSAEGAKLMRPVK